MPTSQPPLPFTPLVYRALAFAHRYRHLLGISTTTIPTFLEALHYKHTPHFSYRDGDTVDRYDRAGLYLYVRPEVVILLVGPYMVCASQLQGRVYLQQLHLGEAASAILGEEPL